MASILKVTEITTPDGTGNITVSRPLTGGTGVKGGDIASASPLVIDTDGDYFDVTGTTNFAAMTVAADRQFTLQFDGALTMTHHATNLDLPGEANITTAAGDVGVFQSTGANTVQCISYVKADGTAVVGSVEGTAVLSTGEAGGTKFLREDGDGTSSWQDGGASTYIGYFTRDLSTASGSQAITGVGFEPAALYIMAVHPYTAGYFTDEVSWGLVNAGSSYVLENSGNASADSWDFSNVAAVYLIQASSSNYNYASIALDADGFTLTWTKGGSPTGTAKIIYLAIA